MIIGDGVMLGAGGETASIFVTGLSETDTVTATKGSKTKTGKWTQKPNPAAHGLPDGYTQLEYIESTGTQYINTGVSPTSNLKCSMKITTNSSAVSHHAVLGSTWSDSGYFLLLYNSAIRWHSKGVSIDVSSINVSGVNEIEVSPTSIIVNGVPYSLSGTGTDSTNPVYLFATSDTTSDGDGHYIGRFKLHSFKMYNGETPIRNYIPAKRNSDSEIGLYDIVNDVFYTNAGTGTFTAGAEVPQTFYGFLIDKIKDFGTWTVTASNEAKTITQDILVDVITEYVIYMELKNYLMLYDYGDECEDVTGGWTDGLLNSNDIYPYLRYIRTQLWIDASEYTKCAINVSFGNSTDIGGNGILVGDTPPNVQSWRSLNPSDIQTSGLSVHAMNANEGYFHIGVDNGTMTSNSVTKNQNNIYIYTRSGSSWVRELYVYNFVLCKQDDWSTLCTKAGITAPSDLATLISDVASISTILGNAASVNFMVGNCTGDFMVSFVANSNCLTALDSSPYKSIVLANRHWSKFLAMVGVTL